MFLNASIPEFECYVRKEFLYDFERGYGEHERAVVFGVASIPGHAIGWHVLLRSGAVFYRLPIHALRTTLGGDDHGHDLHDLELWDCFSEDVAVTEFDFLRSTGVAVRIGKKWEAGTYRFTIDWTGSAIADGAGEIGHKCAHIIQLACGQLAAQPNNRILWRSSSFADKTDAVPDYKLQSRTWSVEGRERTIGDGYFYEVSR